MEKIAKYIDKNKKDFPDISSEKVKKYSAYKGGPMTSKERRNINFIIDEYDIEHLLVYLKCILKPAYWQFLRAMCIIDIIPNYDLYKEYY